MTMETALIFQIVYPTWVARAETTLLIVFYPLRQLVVDFCLSDRFESCRNAFERKPYSLIYSTHPVKQV